MNWFRLFLVAVIVMVWCLAYGFHALYGADYVTTDKLTTIYACSVSAIAAAMFELNLRKPKMLKVILVLALAPLVVLYIIITGLRKEFVE